MTRASGPGSTGASSVPTGSRLASTHPLTGQGWLWYARRGEGREHLFPPNPPAVTTSACFRVRCPAAELEEVLALLLDAPATPRCKSCARRDGWLPDGGD